MASTQLKKPRILFLVTEFYYFASHKMDLAAAASRAGFDVYVAARCSSLEAEGGPGITIIPLSWERSGSIFQALLAVIPDVFRVMAVMAQVKPSVVHNIALKPAIVGSIAALGRKARVLNSINGFGFVFHARSRMARMVQWGCKFVLKVSAKLNDGRVILQNADDAGYVTTRMGINAAQVRLIRGSGIDVDLFQPVPEPPSPPVRFVILARLLKMKGIQVALAALDVLRQRGLEVELVVCGASDPGNPSSIPESQVQEWALMPGVTFKGQVDDIRSVVSEGHVVIHPSLGGEGLPRALLEGAALERPLIASDVAGNREMIIQGETGLLVPPDDAEKLADAMAWLATHPMERERWGRAGRQKVLGEFTSHHVQAQHEALYAEALEQNNVP